MHVSYPPRSGCNDKSVHLQHAYFGCDIAWLRDLLIEYARMMTNHTLLYLSREHMVFGIRKLQRRKYAQTTQTLMVHKAYSTHKIIVCENYTTPNGNFSVGVR